MPISWEWHHRIEGWVKPCGNHRWSDDAVATALGELSVAEGKVVLDAGCGPDSWIVRRIREAGAKPRVIGIDVDDACFANPALDEAKVASIYEIPLPNESVDLVLSGYVFEHLEDPEAALREIRRVMKPGALFISWTPNRWNPVIMLSAVTSQKTHVRLRSLTWGNAHADNAPTFYRANTIAAIRQCAERAGFTCEHIDTYSTAYVYFRMTRLTFLLAGLANRVMVLWPLNKARLTILFCLRKRAAA